MLGCIDYKRLPFPSRQMYLPGTCVLLYRVLHIGCSKQTYFITSHIHISNNEKYENITLTLERLVKPLCQPLRVSCSYPQGSYTIGNCGAGTSLFTTCLSGKTAQVIV